MPDTRLGDYLCRGWMQGHRRHVARVETHAPKSTSDNMRYIERVVKVLDRGDGEEGSSSLDDQAVRTGWGEGERSSE